MSSTGYTKIVFATGSNPIPDGETFAENISKWCYAYVPTGQYISSFTRQYRDTVLTLQNTLDWFTPKQFAAIIFPFQNGLIVRHVYLRIDKMTNTNEIPTFELHHYQDSDKHTEIPWSHTTTYTFPEETDIDELKTVIKTYSLATINKKTQDETGKITTRTFIAKRSPALLANPNLLNIPYESFQTSQALDMNRPDPVLLAHICYVLFHQSKYPNEAIHPFVASLTKTKLAQSPTLLFAPVPPPTTRPTTPAKSHHTSIADNNDEDEPDKPLTINQFNSLFSSSTTTLANEIYSRFLNARVSARLVPNTVTALYTKMNELCNDRLPVATAEEDLKPGLFEEEIAPDHKEDPLPSYTTTTKFDFNDFLKWNVNAHGTEQLNQYLHAKQHNCPLPGPCLLNVMRESDFRTANGTTVALILREIGLRYVGNTMPLDEHPFSALEFMNMINDIQVIHLITNPARLPTIRSEAPPPPEHESDD